MTTGAYIESLRELARTRRTIGYSSIRPTIASTPATRTRKHAGPTIVVYAAVFNKQTMIGSYFREQIAPNAFTIGREDVRALFNHDASWLLGRSRVGTLRLSQEARGLRYSIDINPDDTLAMSVVAKVKRGDISGSSFAFTVDPDDERWEFTEGKVEPLRTILQASLIDVSPVTFPAYPQTIAEIGR